PFLDRIIASDLTPRMLALAREFLTAQGARNAEFVIADAEHLPFLDATFTLVTARIAPHHYADARLAVQAITRVLRPSARCILVDTTWREDPGLDAALNAGERGRDPSHVRDHTLAEWHAMLRASGLSVTDTEVMKRAHDFQPWVERVRMPHAAAANLE